MLKTSQIHIRDPFIVTYNEMYYMYGTHDMFDTDGDCLYVYHSKDLSNWEEPKLIFTLPENFWAGGPLWAPEVHCYSGKYYLLVTLLGKHGLRGTQIAVSDTPDGPFIPITNGPATPPERSCIDGTLYVDNGTPYIVYSADWPDNYIPEKDVYVGQIRAVQLTEDLTQRAGEPFTLFASTDCPLSAAAPCRPSAAEGWITRYGSDGPFLRKLSNGSLLLTWSPVLDMNYAVLGAISQSGTVRGPWTHLPAPIFDKNGGHSMIFEDLQSRLIISLHQPEHMPNERAAFWPVKEENGTLRLV